MRSLLPLAAITCLVSVPASAQSTLTWNTDTAASNWSDSANWTPVALPAGNDIVFGDTFGKTANATTVGNIVDTSVQINSLSYTNISGATTPWQVTQIAAGQTLTVDAAGAAPATIFNVGTPVSGVGINTRVAIRGAGTLNINEAASNFVIGTPAANTSALLDMSGLDTFNATVDAFNMGVSRGNGDVTLAGANTITANTMTLGDALGSSGGGSRSDLLLGTTNTINTDTLNLGLHWAGGGIAFRSGLTNATVTIRGTAGGTSRTDLTIGNTLTTGITNGQTSGVDFTLGTVDARIDDLVIGRRGDAGSFATYSGSLSMSRGVIDANTVLVGQTAGVGTGTTSSAGIVSVSGGTFAAGSVTLADNAGGLSSVAGTFNVSGSANVVVAGNFTAGSHAGTGTAAIATVNISNGTLLIQGNLVEGVNAGSVTSNINLSGGNLNMDHGAISVDSFTFTGGTLKDVASFSAGITGGLSLQNNSSLAFGLDGGFTTLDLTGSLTLGASSNLILSLADGFTPGSSFTLVANDAFDSVTGAFATINGASYTTGDSFFLSNDLGTYEYQLTYTGGVDGNDVVINLVPEPSAALLLGLGLGTVLVFRRRKF